METNALEIAEELEQEIHDLLEDYEEDEVAEILEELEYLIHLKIEDVKKGREKNGQ